MLNLRKLLKNGTNNKFLILIEQAYLEIMTSKTIYNSCICPIISSNITFDKLKLHKGIYLIDLKKHDIWKNVNKSLRNFNVAILLNFDEITFAKDDEHIDIEHITDLIGVYFFIKTHKSCKFEKSIDTTIKLVNGEIKIINFSEPSDPFEKWGHAYISYYNYTWGNDRKNIFNQEAFDKIKCSVDKLDSYSLFIEIQKQFKPITPLGASANTFMAGFANPMWDEPKLILATASLEALFLDSNSELVFKLAHNIAWFLEPKISDYSKRKQLICTIKNIYRERSKIVHGAFPEISDDIWDSSLALLTRIYSKILETKDLQKYFLNKKEHKKLLKMLEIGKTDF